MSLVRIGSNAKHTFVPVVKIGFKQKDMFVSSVKIGSEEKDTSNKSNDCIQRKRYYICTSSKRSDPKQKIRLYS